MEIKEIREMSGLNRSAFSRAYHIPLRTVEDWEAGRRKCPDYVKEMLERIIREDKKMMQNWKEILRFESDGTLESIKAGLREATGEEDFLGFECEDDEQAYLDRCFRSGSLEKDGEYIIVNTIK